MAGLVALAWLRLVQLERAMDPMDSMEGMDMGPARAPWTLSDFGSAVAMWSVMMVGMMLPSATPVILLFASARAKRTGTELDRATAAFGLGYLLVWGLFSFAAALGQGALQRAALLSPMYATTSAWLGGGVLIAAGVYQWTPLKSSCLRHCRSPLAFLMAHWRDGTWSALGMGAHHGWYCLGCCWLLMSLLFVAGIMNLVWVAAIAAFVLLEKVLPQGVWLGRLAGVVIVVLGVGLLFRG